MISTQLFLHQELLSININSPIKNLLVLINQSFTLFRNFSTELEFLNKVNDIWYEIKYRKLLSQVMKRSSFIFKENHVFIEEDYLSDKVVTIEEEQNAVEVDGIAK